MPVRTDRMPLLVAVLLATTGLAGTAQARLTVTDKLTAYRHASSEDRVDLAARLGKSFSALSPGLTRDYFIKCLEETANVGDPRELEIAEAVRLCVAAQRGAGEE